MTLKHNNALVQQDTGSLGPTAPESPSAPKPSGAIVVPGHLQCPCLEQFSQLLFELSPVSPDSTKCFQVLPSAFFCDVFKFGLLCAGT